MRQGRCTVLAVALAMLTLAQGAVSFGKSLEEVAAKLGDSSAPLEERAGAGAEILRSLITQRGPIAIVTRDYDTIGRTSLAVLGESEPALQEIAATLMLAIPSSEFDEPALEKLVANGRDASLAVRLVTAKGLTTPTAAAVLRGAMIHRPDTDAYQMAVAESVKRATPGMAGDLVAALSDQRAGIQLAAAQALIVKHSETTPLDYQALQQKLAEAELKLKQHLELAPYLPQTGSTPAPSQEQKLVSALKKLLEEPKKNLPPVGAAVTAAPGNTANSPPLHTKTGLTESQNSPNTTRLGENTLQWVWLLATLMVTSLTWLFHRILRRR